MKITSGLEIRNNWKTGSDNGKIYQPSNWKFNLESIDTETRVIEAEQKLLPVWRFRINRQPEVVLNSKQINQNFGIQRSKYRCQNKD